MAFLSRVSNLLKKSGSKHAVSGCIASNPSLFQAIRSMSSSKLFVGGISFQTDEMSLREAFSQYGEIVETRLIMDRETGRSRGFGFVTYTSTESASSAIQALDGQDLHGRRIRVNYATERPRSPGFGGGFGGGNYGGQGGNYGQGGYQGGGYPAGDSNYGGASGGYGGGNQYRSGGGGGYGGGSNYGSPADGFGGNYGGGYGDTNAPSVGGGSYNGGDPGFSAKPTGFSSSLSDGPGLTGADEVADIQDGTSAEGFEYDIDKEDHVPNDYANTRS